MVWLELTLKERYAGADDNWGELEDQLVYFGDQLVGKVAAAADDILLQVCVRAGDPDTERRLIGGTPMTTASKLIFDGSTPMTSAREWNSLGVNAVELKVGRACKSGAGQVCGS